MNPDNFTLSVVIPCYNEKNSIHTLNFRIISTINP